MVSYEEQVEDEGAAAAEVEAAKKEAAAAVTEEESKQESSLSTAHPPPLCIGGEGRGGNLCRGRCIVFGQWLFSFFGVFRPGPFSGIALYTLFGSEAISGRRLFLPASHTNLQSCCRFCGYLRCNVATSGPKYEFSFIQQLVSAMVSNSERTGLFPRQAASSKCPSDHSARVGGSGIPARARATASASARASPSPSSAPCCAALCRPVPCHTKIACT